MHLQHSQQLKPNGHHRQNSSPHNKIYWQRTEAPKLSLGRRGPIFWSCCKTPQPSFPLDISHFPRNQSCSFWTQQSHRRA
ncbi:hypothetical protein VIGAN_05176800 [Vigna angularis var. angularis]|uniref:Uncharacterized protein n=1 Tax=Vigna angularis var. angularis TaxID=157739 RepID=A0A0S3S644_PHAAN|nr:hypothetical protein VIGAN_05176800 [Vigna angularis var. angularis]